MDTLILNYLKDPNSLSIKDVTNNSIFSDNFRMYGDVYCCSR